MRLYLSTFISSLCLCLINSLNAQIYPDHFGTGNDAGVTVTSSDTTSNQLAAHTLSGTGLFPDLAGASRFLGQASLGATYEEIEQLTQTGVDAWLDFQFNMAPSSYLNTYKTIFEEAKDSIIAYHGADSNPQRRIEYIYYSFYEKVLNDDDVLRQKVAFALSQILVISHRISGLHDRGYGLASYYDVLYQGAFGNYRDLLSEVTLHPVMGIYLSHMKNKKGDPALNTLPDENFAREVMQLFTIGLEELELNGQSRLDENNQPIPTYTIQDIQELAKVFTGLSGGAWDLELKPENAGQPLKFHKGIKNFDLTVPMMMYEDQHDSGTKTMIDGSVIPAGQNGLTDIEQALDVLFNHPNIAPFISYRLIQQLVKSNPTPGYVKRVAMVFNNNGQGIKGDLKAVVKTILTDPEARNCAWIQHTKGGKLRQPMERFIQLFKAFNIQSPSGKLWFRDMSYLNEKVEQSFIGAPSVFNFFTPFHAEAEFVSPNEMASPEFQILNSVSAIHYLNLIENSIKIRPFPNMTAVNPNAPRLTGNNDHDSPFYDFSDETMIFESNGLAALVDHVDLLLCHGQLSEGTKSIIIDAVTQFADNSNSYTTENAIKDVLYFIMMSPDYVILK